VASGVAHVDCGFELVPSASDVAVCRLDRRPNFLTVYLRASVGLASVACSDGPVAASCFKTISFWRAELNCGAILANEGVLSVSLRWFSGRRCSCPYFAHGMREFAKSA
jgi:hypothetical protein